MICNAAHPALKGVRCGREPGPNARAEDIYRTGEFGEILLDEDGAPQIETPGRDVHVHSGKSADGGTHRWEDAPSA